MQKPVMKHTITKTVFNREVTIPKGTRLCHVEHGGYAVIDAVAIAPKYMENGVEKMDAFWLHDAKYHYVFVDNSDVEFE